MKKFLIFVLIVIVLGGLGYAYYRWQIQGNTNPISNLQTVAASRGELIATIGATGVIRSNQSTILTWQTTGTVENVNVQVGEKVSAGQVLATLKQTSLPQSVILAQVDLANAQQTLENLSTNASIAKIKAMQDIVTFEQAVRDAQYQLDNFTVPSNQANMSAVEAVEVMKKKLEQARQAFEPYKFAPSTDPKRKELKEALDQAQSDYNAAIRRLKYEYDLEIAQFNLDKAVKDYEKWKNGPDPNDVAAAEARIAAAQATLNLATITAPFSGTITNSKVMPGDQVSPGVLAFQIDDLSHLYADVQVSEVDINRVRVGQDATLTFDAILGKEYHGKVIRVDQVGTSTQGVVDFTVTIELNDADQDVKPGMTAAVNLIVDKLENALTVPNRAVRLKDGQRVVYVLREGQLTPIAIKLGLSSDIASEVVEGDLQVGDLIVLNPPTVFETNQHPSFIQR